MMNDFEPIKGESDYLVGVGGWQLLRARAGQIHRATYLRGDEDHEPTQTLSVEYQTLPDTFWRRAEINFVAAHAPLYERSRHDTDQHCQVCPSPPA